jgi:thiol-disulfide isomerase/thioredoxin
MKPFNIFIALVLIVVVGGFVFFRDSFTTTQPQPEPTPQGELRMDLLSYLDYSGANLANAQKKGPTILFFAATRWCHTCSALEKEILERQSEIPENVTILKVDYDNDSAMKQKYSISTQHTQVVLDQHGNEVKRWIGGGFDTLLQEMKEI